MTLHLPPTHRLTRHALAWAAVALLVIAVGAFVFSPVRQEVWSGCLWVVHRARALWPASS